MNKFLCCCATLLLSLTAATSFAADLTGAWTGDFEIPNGDSYHLSLTLKQEGAKLSGIVRGAQIGQIEIFDGKVDGDKVSFSVIYNDMTIKCDGVIRGGQIELTSKSDSAGFPGGEATLTRVKIPDTHEAQPTNSNGSYSAQ